MRWIESLLLALLMILSPSVYVSAQVAGSTSLGVTAEELRAVAIGWSAKKQVLGKTVYNENNEKVGAIDDLIIAPDRAAYGRCRLCAEPGGPASSARHRGRCACRSQRELREGPAHPAPPARRRVQATLPPREKGEWAPMWSVRNPSLTLFPKRRRAGDWRGLLQRIRPSLGDLRILFRGGARHTDRADDLAVDHEGNPALERAGTGQSQQPEVGAALPHAVLEHFGGTPVEDGRVGLVLGGVDTAELRAVHAFEHDEVATRIKHSDDHVPLVLLGLRLGPGKN